MPNCFQLIDKSTGEPQQFAKLDDKICAMMGVEPHPVRYYLGWYDVIGFAVACGKPLGSPELRSYVADMPWETARLLQILDWLEAGYTSDAWVEIGRR